jgi:beta-hydroxyacyl-ACP dehydratase FabZ
MTHNDMPTEHTVIDIERLMQLLPHRYPFLLVDRIIEIEPSVRITGLKNVGLDEPFFAGARARDARMPEMLVVEAMAQTGAVLMMIGGDPAHAKLVYFAGLDNVTWPGVVRPGDQLLLEIKVTHARGKLCKVHGVARVADSVVCEADLAAVLVDPEQQRTSTR